MKAKLPGEDEVLAALSGVADPEVGIDIVELGLVYGVDIGDNRIRISMTTTSPACPTAMLMVEEARAAVAVLAPTADIDIELVWAPAWEPGRMSENAKKKLGW